MTRDPERRRPSGLPARQGNKAGIHRTLDARLTPNKRNRVHHPRGRQHVHPRTLPLLRPPKAQDKLLPAGAELSGMGMESQYRAYRRQVQEVLSTATSSLQVGRTGEPFRGAKVNSDQQLVNTQHAPNAGPTDWYLKSVHQGGLIIQPASL